jgi:hypothetical protein
MGKNADYRAMKLGFGIARGLSEEFVQTCEAKDVPIEAIHRLVTPKGRETMSRIAELIRTDWLAEQRVPAEAVVETPKPNGQDAAPEAEDRRVAHAKVLWEAYWGNELYLEEFEDYLSTVPEIPAELRADDERFPCLVLVDGRIGLETAYRLAKLSGTCDGKTFRPYQPARVQYGIRWMRCNPAFRKTLSSVRKARESFMKDEVGLDAVEGIAVYMQFPRLFQERGMCFPNSELLDASGCVAAIETCCGNTTFTSRPEVDYRHGNKIASRRG